MRVRNLHITILTFCVAALLQSCGQKEFFTDVLKPSHLISGDILVVAGGTVTSVTSPYPLHQIVSFHNDGTYKGIVTRASNTTELLMGATFDITGRNLLYTIDTVDRVAKIDIANPSFIGTHIIDANLSGTTLRGLATLSDGGTVVIESVTVVEKFDSSNTRVTTNFPITVTANIMNVRRLSGSRFAIVFTGGDDRIQVYSDSGTLLTQINTNLACNTNCDPTDIIELSDGRFIIGFQNAAIQGLEIYDSAFTHIGTYYRNSSILPAPTSIARTHDNFVIACTSTFNTCEKFQTIGNSGTRVGVKAFIDQASLIRQPTDVLVVP